MGMWMRGSPASEQPPFSPAPYRLGVLPVVAVRVKPKAMKKPGFTVKFVFRRIPDEFDEPQVDIIPLPQHLGER